MFRFLKLVTINSTMEVKEMLLERVQCPLLTVNKICYGYLNNDLIMVFSNLAILTLSVVFLFLSGTNGKGISG